MSKKKFMFWSGEVLWQDVNYESASYTDELLDQTRESIVELMSGAWVLSMNSYDNS